MKWQALPVQVLRLRSWGDEFVVYNGLSGDTHLLDAIAGQILQALCEAPTEIEALAARLSALWQVDPDAEFHLQIERVLGDLHTLALVDRN